MSSIAFLACVLLVSLARPAAAQVQEWTAAQRDLWAQEERFWRTIHDRDLEGHLELYDDDIVAWGGTAVRTKSEWRSARARQFAERSDSAYEYRLEPLSVKVYDDVGVTYYRARTTWTDVSGNPRTYDRVINHVHRRTPAGWRIIAGAAVPPPPN